MLKRVALLLGFLSVVTPACAWRLTGITIGTIVNYNTLNFPLTPSHWVESDTFSSTWASDGNTYSISDDNVQGWDGQAAPPPNPNGYNASIALLTVTGSSVPLTIIGSLENAMPQLGLLAQNRDSDQGSPPPSSATYKGFGLMSISGTLYGFFGRQPEGGTQFYTDEWTTQIISCAISSDCTVASNWSPLPPAVSFPFTSPMWPLPSTPRISQDGYKLGLFTTPVWVEYGQDYNNSTGTLGGFSLNVDNNTTYAYAFGSDGYSFNGSNDYLGRVPIAGGATTIQNAANWQYYCGPIGGNIATSSNWCSPSVISSYPPAAPPAGPTALFSEPFKVGEVGVQYLPVHGRYIAIFTYYPAANQSSGSVKQIFNTVWQVYEAGTLTGPWKKIQTIVWNNQGYYTPYFLQTSLNFDGGLTGEALAAGNYLRACPTGCYYTMNMMPITFNYANP
jgi:hypothetical protein